MLYANACIGFKTLSKALDRHNVDDLRSLYLQVLQRCLNLQVTFGSCKEERIESYRRSLVELRIFLIQSSLETNEYNTVLSGIPVLLDSLISLADKDCDEIVISCLLSSYSRVGCLALLKEIFTVEVNRLDSLKTLFR